MTCQSPEACCPQTPGEFSLALLPGASSAGTVVLTRAGGGHCHSCIGLGPSNASHHNFQRLHQPILNSGPLQPNKYASVSSASLHPFSGLGTAGQPTRPKRGHPRHKGSPGPRGAPSRAEAQAQWWSWGSSTLFSTQLWAVLCGFKQQLGSTSPQNAVPSLLGQCPRPHSGWSLCLY